MAGSFYDYATQRKKEIERERAGKPYTPPAPAPSAHQTIMDADLETYQPKAQTTPVQAPAQAPAMLPTRATGIDYSAVTDPNIYGNEYDDLEAESRQQRQLARTSPQRVADMQEQRMIDNEGWLRDRAADKTLTAIDARDRASDPFGQAGPDGRFSADATRAAWAEAGRQEAEAAEAKNALAQLDAAKIHQQTPDAWRGRLNMGGRGIGQSIGATAPMLVDALDQAIRHPEQAVDPNSAGMQAMRHANQSKATALEGLGKTGQLLGGTAMSIGQNLAMLPLALVNPKLPMVAMGAQAAADKAYELSERGVGADQALTRGLVSGGIEGLTEAVPVGALFDLIKTGGKSFARNLLKQGGIEATEEGLSYLANYVADKAARDPNAKFDWGELADSMASGGLSGLFFGLGGIGAHRATVAADQAQQAARAEADMEAVNRWTSNPDHYITQDIRDAGPAPAPALPIDYRTGGASYQDQGAMLPLAQTGTPGEALGQDYRLPVMQQRQTETNAETNRQTLPVMPPATAEDSSAVANPAAIIPTVRENRTVEPETGQSAGLPLRINRPGGRGITLRPISQTSQMMPTPAASLQMMPTPQSVAAPQPMAQGVGQVTADVAQAGRGSDVHTAPQQVSPDDSVGAAPKGFDPYGNLLMEYDPIKPGENPVRDVEVPSQTKDDNKVSLTARTVMEAAATPDANVGDIAKMVVDDKLSYIPISNEGLRTWAVDEIKRVTYPEAVASWRADVRAGKSSPKLVAMGAQLYNQAINSGHVQEALDIVADYTDVIRSSAQATQAARILKTLTPEGQLYLTQKAVSRLNDTLGKQLKKKGITVQLSEELAQAYLDAKTDEARAEAMDALMDDVAKQVPATLEDKWNAWRYLAMLGNPRTHVRNVTGNAIFQPIRLAKNVVAASLEKLLPPEKRTKSVLVDPALYKAGWADFKDIKSALNSTKMDDITDTIQDQRQIFRLPPLEWARKANSAALEAEDSLFKRTIYADSFAGFLKARGVTADQLAEGKVDADLLEEARAYAGHEALVGTFNDRNVLSDGVVEMANTKLGKPVSAALLPFKRTPANVLSRALEYSPLELVKIFTGVPGLKVESDIAKLRAGEMTGAELIDHVASGVTGTALLGVGAALAMKGILSGGDDRDPNQARQDDMTGRQSYAINVGDKSYTIDWAAPAVVPLFMGVSMAEALAEDGVTGDSIMQLVKSFSNPLLEMSMLQSLSDALDSAAYAEGSDKIGAIAASALVSYITQGIPTVLGQAERASEPERMRTYTNKGAMLPTDVQYALGRASGRILGWDYQQIPYVDAWGRHQSTGTTPQRIFNNFINPAFVAQKNITPVDQELERLHDAGYKGVYPDRVSQTEQLSWKDDPDNPDAETQYRYMSGPENQAYAEGLGQKSYDVITDMIQSPLYQQMSDEEKAQAIGVAYEYSKNLQQEKYVGDKHGSAEYVDKAQAAKGDLGMTEAEYLLNKQTYGSDRMNSDKLRTAYDLGLPVPKTMEIWDRKSQISDKTYPGATWIGGEANEKRMQQTEMDRYLDSLGLTPDQRTQLGEDFRIWGQRRIEPYPYSIDTLSDGGRDRWPFIQSNYGYSEDEYAKLYPIYSQSKKKGPIIQDLQTYGGLTEQQAYQFWGRMGKADKWLKQQRKNQ